MLNLRLAKSTSTQEEINSSQKGAILPLFALSIFVIITILAMAIDLSHVGEGAERTRRYAGLATLAALDAHFGQPAGTSRAARYAAALRKAQEVSATNLLVGDVGSGSKHRPNKIADNTANQQNQASLVPGKMVRKAGDYGLNCDQPGEMYPCFRESDLGNNDDPINAYRLRGKYYENLPFFLSRVVNNRESIETSISAVAGATPANFCFVVDISKSVVGNNFQDGKALEYQKFQPLGEALPYNNLAAVGALPPPGSKDETAGRSSSFVYLPDDNTRHNQIFNTFLKVSDPAYPNLTLVNRPTNAAEWDVFLNEFGTNIASLSDDIYQKLHFFNEYAPNPINTLGDSEYNATTHKYFAKPDELGDTRLLIGSANGFNAYPNIYKDPAPVGGKQYLGPEPYRSIINGVRDSIEYLRDAKIAGTKICVIMFESTARWSTVIKPFAVDDTQAVQDVLAMLNVDDPAAFNKMIEYNMFPSPSGYSNTLAGFNLAHYFIKQENNSFDSLSRILLFTDGRTNCKNDNPAAGGYGCDDSPANFDVSTKNLKAAVITESKANNIPVDIFLVGDHVAPYMVKYRNLEKNDGSCYSEAEARRKGLYPVKSSGADEATLNSQYANANSQHPFDEANFRAFDALGKITGGTWNPVYNVIRDAAIDPCVPQSGCPDEVTYFRKDPECHATMRELIFGYLRKLLRPPYILYELR